MNYNIIYHKYYIYYNTLYGYLYHVLPVVSTIWYIGIYTMVYDYVYTAYGCTYIAGNFNDEIKNTRF